MCINDAQTAMTRTHVRERVRDPYTAFSDREEAGRRLVEFIDPEPDPEGVVMTVPRGGVPVGRPLAAALGCPLQLILTRKLPVPTSPEAGFGAVSLESGLVLNDRMVNSIGISDDRIDEIVGEVREELRRRAREYDVGTGPASLEGRHIYLVDDGLATGYTMIAAAKEMRAHEPGKLTLAVPVSPTDSLDRVGNYVDETYCLICQTSFPFAVASFYARFEEMSDEQVRRILREAEARRAD